MSNFQAGYALVTIFSSILGIIFTIIDGMLLWAIGFFSFNALIDMKPKAGAIYIHSASEAYNEEQVLSTKRLKNWIDKFQMEHHQIHCSGHAKGEDLMDMVKEIDAKVLFPVHTEYPTEYIRVINKINMVELNKKYEI